MDDDLWKKMVSFERDFVFEETSNDEWDFPSTVSRDSSLINKNREWMDWFAETNRLKWKDNQNRFP